MARLRRIIARIFLALVLILVALFAFGVFLIRRSYPDVDGEMKLAGLDSSVRILRDRYGIPQIYASSQRDLFFAQGFVHAQDRFWQMDVWRHTGAGRLSEMFGKSQVETDQFLRTLGWEKVVRQELKTTDTNSMKILESYAAGVNAYLKDRKGSEIAFEYLPLSLTNKNYTIESWEPADSYLFGKVMSWDLCGNMFSEINKSLLLKTLSSEQVDEIYPEYPENGPFVITETISSSVTAVAPTAMLQERKILDSIQSVHASIENLPAMLRPQEISIGSNNWVISGSRTTTGKPMLANDPHLGVQMPSIWYEAGLHCEPVSDECPYDVAGFSFAGVPGIILGHNARIAWAMTNTGADVMDLYIEKVNPENPNQYLYQNSWRDMDVSEERIRVAGGDDVKVSVRRTHHGPLISDTMKLLKDYGNDSGQDLPKPFSIALRWTALEPSDTFPAIWKMNIAKNWEQFRAAASEFDVPSQNLMYADVDGNIGYQTPGLIPIRAKGDGRFPVPGWTDEYEWQGYIPFNELPSLQNPERGFIASANNKIISSQYPHLITSEWDSSFRAARIMELINKNTKPIDKTFISSIQADNKNPKAQMILPHVLNLKFQDIRLIQAREVLRNWDQQNKRDSSGAALFEMFWKFLMSETFHDDLPEQFWPGGAERWGLVIQNIANDPENLWWDNKKTPVQEDRGDILVMAFRLAVQELQKVQGTNPAKWRWGRLHTITFRNETLGQSGITLLERVLNRGPFECNGGTSIVNACSFNAKESFEVTAIPSMRMIVDFASMDQSMAINSTGQSGHPYHTNYTDMIDQWQNVQYHSWPFSKAAVEKETTDTLVLTPLSH